MVEILKIKKILFIRFFFLSKDGLTNWFRAIYLNGSISHPLFGQKLDPTNNWPKKFNRNPTVQSSSPIKSFLS